MRERGEGAKRRRGVFISLRTNSASKRVNDAAQRCLLELERRLVHHQVRADVHDALHLDQVVGLERVAGGHQIDDGVGQAGERGELHAAVEFDQVDMHALAGEKIARNGGVFGRHLQAPTGLHGAGVVKAE